MCISQFGGFYQAPTLSQVKIHIKITDQKMTARHVKSKEITTKERNMMTKGKHKTV